MLSDDLRLTGAWGAWSFLCMLEIAGAGQCSVLCGAWHVHAMLFGACEFVAVEISSERCVLFATLSFIRYVAKFAALRFIAKCCKTNVHA